jgi:hypothetical protein
MGNVFTKSSQRVVSDVTRLLKKRGDLSNLLTKLLDDKKTPSSKKTVASLLVENEENIPRAAALKIRDVRDIVTGASLGTLVVEPQDYDTVKFLDLEDFMFSEEGEPLGYFHHETSGLAHSGDGGDYGDLWWKVCPALYRFLHEWVGTAQSLLRGTLKNEEKVAADLKKKYKKNTADKYPR